MIHTLSVLFSRAKDIFQTEGLRPLLSRGFARYFFQYRTFYLYKRSVIERNEADFLPRIQNFTVKIVSTNQQADELAADSIDFRSRFVNARRCLDKGAIAFCIFVDRELAHLAWVAMSEEAKNTFDYLPYHVEFSNKEACTGGAVTIPKYRGKGLLTYSHVKRDNFLSERGIITVRNAVATNNIATQKVQVRDGPSICAKARYLKILWWKFWKETPLIETSHHNWPGDN